MELASVRAGASGWAASIFPLTIWGGVAAHLGVRAALLCAGAGTIATTALALFFRLPDATVDLTAWNHWRLPAVGSSVLPAGDDSGPVLVTVEYEVVPENVEEFIKARAGMDAFGSVMARSDGGFSATWRSGPIS